MNSKVDWKRELELEEQENERIERIKHGEKPKPRHRPKGSCDE